MSAWMPIESAPRDGTEIVAWNGSAWICMFINGCWEDGEYRGNILNITHWMPLPPPPASPRYEITPEGRKALEGK